MSIRAGFAVTGSFCTFSKAIPQIEELMKNGFEVLPILSEISYSTDTRFGTAQSFIDRIEKTTGREIIHTVKGAEPIGPKKLLDILIIAPCTGNTLGKLANGITDTSVTMSAKAHLRNGRPVLVAVSSNDALSASLKNIGMLMNAKNYYFAPMRQDNPAGKPTSLVADMTMIVPAAKEALEGRQIQPLLLAAP